MTHENRGLRIGELARQSGLSVDTLRHYERLQLLPVLRRTEGGFRQYPPDAVRRVKVIQQALAIGFGLEELSSFFKERTAGRAPCRAVRRLAQAKFEALEQYIQRLLAGREALHALLENWDERLHAAQGQPARLLDSLAELEPFPANLSPRLPRKRSR
ncbi:MAG TPA: MerR family transcriptional regulator [Polyangiales bacterium]|nr:MerR family transcriptional regulator [Polyangiales bacterium]